MIGLKGVVGAGFLLAGSALASFALWNILQNIVAWPGEIEVRGEIIALSSAPGGTKCGTSYRPLARFLDAQGNRHEIVGKVGLCSRNRRKAATHAVGDKVTIRYPADSPQDARLVDLTSSLWFAFTFAFSLPFLATGIWAIRSDRRELREDGWIE